MVKYNQDKKICVKDNTKHELDKIGIKTDTYDGIIQLLLASYKTSSQ